MSTANELEARAIQTLGNDLGKTYFYLYSQIAFLKIKWDEYRKIYHVSKEQIEFLNQYAPFYFSVNQKILFNDILLHIAKLTDKEKSCGNDNLSLLKLKSLLSSNKKYLKINISIGKAMDLSSVLITWRNKYLAHYDFYVLTNQNNNILNEISVFEVDNIITSMWEVIKIMGKEVFNDDLQDEVIPKLGGADIFVKKMKGEYGKGRNLTNA